MSTITRKIDNTDDVIDSRDVIERIEHLAQLREPGPVDLGEDDNETAQDELFAELAILEKLAEQGEGCADWKYGEALIRDSYFEDYARELANDIGAIKDDARWPNNCIDWEKAACELRTDYTCIDFDGVDYWVRS